MFALVDARIINSKISSFVLGIEKFRISLALCSSSYASSIFFANSLIAPAETVSLNSYPQVGQRRINESKISPQFGHL